MKKNVILIVLVILILSSCRLSNEKIDRPNIIYIMADDHAVQSISSYGSRLIQTPGIDRLANEGMKFTNCFNVNSLSAPSRAVLISGKYSKENGVLRIGDRLDEKQKTFPILLQQAGYNTALIGKWHLILEPKGFDYYSVLPGQGSYFNGRLKEKGTPWEDGNKGGVDFEGYVTDVITDLAIDWISKNNSEKPFFLMVHHKAPHTPHLYPEKYAKLYENEDLPIPETFYDDYNGKNPGLASENSGYSRLDQILPVHFQEKVPDDLSGTEFKKWAYQTFFKGYLRLVAALDENVNRLLDYLDETGLSKNTVVIYTSDNGFFHGEHGLFNKMWMYEESMRLPLIVRFPGVIKAGSVNEHLVSILDFAPTFLDIAKAPVPSSLQGKSIKPLLTGNNPEKWRDGIFYHYFGQFEVPEHYGIRTGKYKLIHFKDKSGNVFGELYDLKTDKNEMENLYYKPEFESAKNELEIVLNQMKIEAEHDSRSK